MRSDTKKQVWGKKGRKKMRSHKKETKRKKKNEWKEKKEYGKKERKMKIEEFVEIWRLNIDVLSLCPLSYEFRMKKWPNMIKFGPYGGINWKYALLGFKNNLEYPISLCSLNREPNPITTMRKTFYDPWDRGSLWSVEISHKS